MDKGRTRLAYPSLALLTVNFIAMCAIKLEAHDFAYALAEHLEIIQIQANVRASRALAQDSMRWRSKTRAMGVMRQDEIGRLHWSQREAHMYMQVPR